MKPAILLFFALFSLSACQPQAKAENAKSAHATLKTPDGKTVATARFTAIPSGVRIQVDANGLPPGRHGIHIHEKAACDPPAFTSAGDHLRTATQHHGLDNPQGPHEGDLPNLEIGSNEKGKFNATSNRITLGDGENSLFHQGGTSLIIHAAPDDQKTDPSGNSGDRIACGVITSES
jgi:Cu-Zn family superoxide dismutase